MARWKCAALCIFVSEFIGCELRYYSILFSINWHRYGLAHSSVTMNPLRLVNLVSVCILSIRALNSIKSHIFSLDGWIGSSRLGSALFRNRTQYNNSISPKAQDMTHVTLMLRIINSLHISVHFLISILYAECEACECVWIEIIIQITCQLNSKSNLYYSMNGQINGIPNEPHCFIYYEHNAQAYNARMLIVNDCLSMGPIMDQIKINIFDGMKQHSGVYTRFCDFIVYGSKFLKCNKLPCAQCSTL